MTMMYLPFVGNLLAAMLYVAAFRKAGFRGLWLALAAVPLVATTAAMFAMGATMPGGAYGMSVMMTLPWVAVPLSLIPLLALAVLPWPATTNPADPE